MRNIQDELQQRISLIQQHFHAVETLLQDADGLSPLEELINDMQEKLVDVQISFHDGDETPFLQGTSLHDCLVSWEPSEKFLTIFIPNSWERVHTRQSLYIKDINKHGNAKKVKRFYTRLFKAIMERERAAGTLHGFDTFENCYSGILFHFPDRYVRDADNQMVKVLHDAAKLARIYATDDYHHLIYMAGGIYDPGNSGMSLYFSDSPLIFERVMQDVETVSMKTKNHIPITDKKPYSNYKLKIGTWF